MKIDYNGRVYELDIENITLKQSMAIQEYLGSSIFGALKQFDGFKDSQEDTPEMLRAIGAIYWLMMNQAGDMFPIGDTDFPLVPFMTAFFKTMAAEAAAAPEAEPDPTQPPTSPPASASPPALPTQTPLAVEEGAAQPIAS